MHDQTCKDKSKLAYTKSMSKVLFGLLDTRNQVDVVMSVTSFMSEIFSTYPLAQPIYHKLSWKEEAMSVEEQTQSNPSLSNPSNQPPTHTPS